MLDELAAPFDCLEADLLSKPEQERALAELALRNPAQTFPTLWGGTRVAAGPLPEDLRRLAARFAPAKGFQIAPDKMLGTGAEAARLYEALAPVQATRGFAFNPDKTWSLEVLAGLLVNEARYGYGSCPGRLATGSHERDRDIVCPCAFRAEDAAKYGRCYCHLYFSPGDAAGRVPAVPDRWLR
jgi:ferredoxin-thioredoxin reductase catalytic subunit